MVNSPLGGARPAGWTSPHGRRIDKRCSLAVILPKPIEKHHAGQHHFWRWKLGPFPIFGHPDHCPAPPEDKVIRICGKIGFHPKRNTKPVLGSTIFGGWNWEHFRFFGTQTTVQLLLRPKLSGFFSFWTEFAAIQ